MYTSLVEAIVTEIKVTSEMTAKSMDETEDMWSHFCLQMKWPTALEGSEKIVKHNFFQPKPWSRLQTLKLATKSGFPF